MADRSCHTRLDRAVANVQALWRKYDKGRGSPVDELIAERRAEAAREWDG